VVAVKAIETDPALLVRAFTERKTFESVLYQFRKQTAVALNRFNGTSASRLATFQKPSAKALREFLDT